MSQHADQDAQTRQAQQRPPANEAGADARGQQESSGMLEAGGDMANVDRQEHAAPIGVPDVPGTVNSPGTVSTAGAPGTPSLPKQADVLGTVGNVGGAAPANLEPGTSGVPGTPVPAPTGGQLASDKVPEAPGPQSPSPADLSVGDTPTPGQASGGQADAGTQPHYGTSGTPGLGGARPTNSDGAGAQGDTASNQNDEHVVADEHGIRSTGSVSGTGGTGIERLGGMPGGTPNYGGVGSPGGSTGLGTGRGPGPDAKERGERGGGLGTGGQVVSGSGGPNSTQVLPGGVTRPGSAEADGQQEDPVALARQAGDSALNTGPSSTGGTLQRAPGTPGATSAPASPYPGIAASDVQPAGGGGTAVPGGDEQKDKQMEQTRSDQPNPDEKSGTGMGAAANDVDRGGAEAATLARSGGGATVGGSPPPSGAPPAPVTPDPYGGTISESHADPGFPPAVPEQPTPGLTREPGPEAHT